MVGRSFLASTSMEQGRHASCHAFGTEVHTQPELFPYGIYAVPEISMVGLTEQECSARGIASSTSVPSCLMSPKKNKKVGQHKKMKMR